MSTYSPVPATKTQDSPLAKTPRGESWESSLTAQLPGETLRPIRVWKFGVLVGA